MISAPAALRWVKSWIRSRRSAAEMVLVAVLSRLPIRGVRVAGLRALGAQVAPRAVLYHGFQARAGRQLVIVGRSNIGGGAILDARGGLAIGDDVNFSTGLQIWTAHHEWNSIDFACGSSPMQIADPVWVGPLVTILPGTTIGEGAIIAAGAVVRGALEPFILYGGVAAKKIGERGRDLSYALPGPRNKTWWR